MRLIDHFIIVRERPVKVVPGLVIAALLSALLAQIIWHDIRPDVAANASKLPSPPAALVIQAISLGEPVALAKFLMLWLQAFDHQPGISVPYKDLDYDQVIAWLDTILALDPKSQYPLLSASRVYAEVPDKVRQRKMLEFVYERFLQDPNTRWPWLAHAVYVAKHRMGEPDLALKYARALRLHATAAAVPAWARQMELFILEDLGDIESAKILLGGLLDSGVIKDANELRFFEERLEKDGEENGVRRKE